MSEDLRRWMNSVGGADDLFEMANLGRNKTGITGFVHVRTAVASHGPSVKFYAKLGEGQPNFSVTIEDAPRVVASSMTERDVARYAPAVVRFVALNKDKLLKFWSEGRFWEADDVHAFLNSFTKVVE